MHTRTKTTLSFAAAALLTLGLAGCSAGATGTAAAPADEPADLVGEWEQSNKNSEDSYQSATITADTITVYWVTDGGDTTSLYWAGTYDAPTEPGDFSWDSVNDTEQTDVALLASGDETKTFTYEGDTISYEVSAMGVTTTVELSR